MLRNVASAVVILAISTLRLTAASFTYELVNHPNAGLNGTSLYGITSDGTAYGTYADASNMIHSFAYRGGIFTGLNFIGIPEGVSAGGTIVGWRETAALSNPQMRLPSLSRGKDSHSLRQTTTV